MLTDRQYRLWVGMITEADDEGRLVADASFLRAVVFPYQPKLTVRQVSDDLLALSQVGLVSLYTVKDARYAEFPSWRDHQRINRPQESVLPSFQSVSAIHGTFTERSLNVHGGKEGIGEEGKGVEGKGGGVPDPLTERIPEMKRWPSPEALAALWNDVAKKSGLPLATTLSQARRDKANRVLRQFPDWQFWTGSLSRIPFSKFLTGRVPPSGGHSKAFRADFDWVCSTKDGVENIVKLHDGKYDDGGA